MHRTARPIEPCFAADHSFLAPIVVSQEASPVPREWYSIAETAWALGISEWAVKRLITKGDLESLSLDGRRVVPLRAIHKLLGI